MQVEARGFDPRSSERSTERYTRKICRLNHSATTSAYDPPALLILLQNSIKPSARKRNMGTMEFTLLLQMLWIVAHGFEKIILINTRWR